MAVVYRAVVEGTRGFERPVALKQLLPRFARQTEGIALFVEEARVSSRLDHPHIVQVYEFVQDRRGKPFLVMEWVEGLDLATWLNAHDPTEPSDWAVVCAVGCAVLDALDYAHRHVDDAGRAAPIIHRDVSPGNILLGLHGHAKLADFGLARAMDRARVTGRNILKGKLAYSAPELARGADPSPRSDVFSCGVTLWEAIARRALFDMGDRVESLRRLSSGVVPPLRDFRPDVPPSIAEVVHRALLKDPTERWPSARAMRRQLLAALVEEGRLPDPLELARTVAEMRRRLGVESRHDELPAPDRSGESLELLPLDGV